MAVALSAGLSLSLLAGPGCGEGDDDRTVAGAPVTTTGSAPTAHPVAVDPRALRPAGTELTPGMVVQEGSSLVGPVFPLPDAHGQTDDPSKPLGWQALLVVDADPVEVWDRYAAALGVADRASAVQSCVVSRVVPADGSTTTSEAFGTPEPQITPERFLTEPVVDGEDRIECSASRAGVTMAMAVGATVRHCPDDVERRCDPPPVSHLFLRADVVPDSEPTRWHDASGTQRLRFDRGAAIAADQREGDDGAQPATGAEVTIEPVPIPEGPVLPPKLDRSGNGSSLPVAGERFDDSLDPYLDHTAAALVPEGARSLVAPAMLIECNSGLVAVLEVLGAVDEAVATFDRADETDDPMTFARGEFAGRAWVAGEITTAGGYYLDAIALATDERTSTVLLTECGD